MAPGSAPTGKTKDAGWQIGVSRTVHHQVNDVWDALVSPRGIAVWLGDGVRFAGTEREPYETADGTVGELRSYRPGDRIRLTWQPVEWAHSSTVQIALRDGGDRTGITFHQERLASSEERERQRAHWQRVAAEVIALLEGT